MVELYPHQKEAVSKLHNGSILFGDVGTGKTLTAIAYYAEKGGSKPIYVITTAKKRDSLDWESDAAKFGIGKEEAATVAGVLTVDSWNNIGKYSEVRDAFFIFDEQRLVGSGAWTKAFYKIAKQNCWILLSATPGDTWLDYIPVFVANGFYKHRSEFLQEHVIYSRWSKFPKVERYINIARLVKHKNDLLVTMTMFRHTTRKTEIIPVDYDKDKFERVLNERWNVYDDRPLKDVAELFRVMRKVVNSDSSRIQTIKALMQEHPKLIVFYNSDYELESLRKGLVEPIPTLANIGSLGRHSHPPSGSISSSVSVVMQPSTRTTSASSSGRTKSITTSGDDSRRKKSTTNAGSLPQDSDDSSTRSTAPTAERSSSFQVAEWNGHKHQPIPETDRWVYLVQYQAGSEGWNCIDTDAMVFYSLTYSYKNWHQAHGRTDRLNTPFSTLYYYVLMSNSMIDKAIWRSLQSKKTFNESRFMAKLLDTRSQKEVAAA